MEQGEVKKASYSRLHALAKDHIGFPGVSSRAVFLGLGESSHGRSSMIGYRKTDVPGRRRRLGEELREKHLDPVQTLVVILIRVVVGIEGLYQIGSSRLVSDSTPSHDWYITAKPNSHWQDLRE
jgi:hypothetical protein